MKAFGVARIGRDAEVRYIPSGEAVCNLSLAFNYMLKGEKCTQWVDATLWGKRVESLAPFLTKGAQIGVSLEGVHIEQYQGANGAGSKIVARVVDIELVGGKSDSGQQAPQQRQQAPRPAPARQPAGGSGFEDMEDDIPF